MACESMTLSRLEAKLERLGDKCKYGHTRKDNSYLNTTGELECRVCSRARQLAYDAKHKEQKSKYDSKRREMLKKTKV